MIHIVEEYNNYVNNLSHLIEESDYKLDFYLRKLNVSKPTMYRKLREKSFTNDEIYTLTELLFPKDAYRKQLKESIKEVEKELKDDEVYTSDQVREKLNQILLE